MKALSGRLIAGLVTLLACLLSLGEQTGDVRLVGGNTINDGRVEIFHDGTWGAVCNDMFGQDNKGCTVVCRQLGYSGGGALTTSGHGTGPILLGVVNCQGGEKRLMDCRHQPWREHNCNSRDGAACSCDFQVRLVGGGSFNEGRVEVLYKNSWGSVCDFGNHDNHSACTAVCDQLGYTGTHVNKEFGRSSSGKIWLDNVSCKKGDQRLAACSHLPWGEHNCRQHNIVAGCSCHVDVHLAGDGRPYRGLVEVLYEKSWHALFWDDYEADDMVACKLICHHLGHSERNAFATQYKESDSIEHSEVACLGHEGQLQRCVEDHQSHPQHTKGCSCEPAAEGEVRLVGGKSIFEGRVEVVYNGTWGTVCSDHFPIDGCTVACRQLGYSGIPFSKSFGRGTGLIWLDDVRCRGNESRIEDCKHRPWGENNCDHREDAGCVCNFNLPVRLVGSNNTHEGRVAVLYGKAWGTICDDGVPSDSACNVTCRQLAFGGHALRKQYDRGTGEMPMLIDQLACLGKESGLTECAIRFSSAAKICNHGRDLACACSVQEGVPGQLQEEVTMTSLVVLVTGILLCVCAVFAMIACAVFQARKQRRRSKRRTDDGENPRDTGRGLRFEMQASPMVRTTEHVRPQEQPTNGREEKSETRPETTKAFVSTRNVAAAAAPPEMCNVEGPDEPHYEIPRFESSAAAAAPPEMCKLQGPDESHYEDPRPESSAALGEGDGDRYQSLDTPRTPDDASLYCQIDNVNTVSQSSQLGSQPQRR